MRRYLLIYLVSIMSLSTQLAAQTFESGHERVGLIELYTSEGCSSCPRADRWLNGLLDHPDVWRRFVPVAMHVTYWDSLGWRDRYASTRYDRRQRLHRRQGHSNGVYTPGFFVAGSEWRGWFVEPSLKIPRETAGNLTVTVVDSGIEVRYLPDPQLRSAGDPRIAHVALLGFELKSSVSAGENRGENFEHHFVALEHQVAETVDSSTGRLMWQFNSFPQWDGEQPLALAAWVEAEHDIVPIQATGGWLVAP